MNAQNNIQVGTAATSNLTCMFNLLCCSGQHSCLPPCKISLRLVSRYWVHERIPTSRPLYTTVCWPALSMLLCTMDLIVITVGLCRMPAPRIPSTTHVRRVRLLAASLLPPRSCMRSTSSTLVGSIDSSCSQETRQLLLLWWRIRLSSPPLLNAREECCSMVVKNTECF